MGTLHSWGAAARRSPVFWIALVAIVAGATAAGVVLATRTPGPPSPSASLRAVALGDSVPYGHGLANPYLTPQLGGPSGAISQGPSPSAYPTVVAGDLGLSMTVRPTNCDLTGDQLAVSGAVADPVDNTARDGQCPRPPQRARNLGGEIAAADLAKAPARLVLLQDGADDIHFSKCLEYELARFLGAGIGLGTDCVENGTVTPQLATDLSHVHASLASAIETVAPHAAAVAVLDYYQPIPSPAQIGDDTGLSGLSTNLVCTGLKANATSTYAAAQVVLGALNRSIAAAVADARAHGVRNVTLVDISSAMSGHGLCTADPWVFSSEPLSDTTLAADLEHISAAKACSATSDLFHTPSRVVHRDGDARRAVAPRVRVADRPSHGGRTSAPLQR